MERRGLYQKMTLLAMAGLIAVFGVLTAVCQARKGVAFEDALLRVTEYGDRTVYSGRAHGQPVTVTVAEDPENGALATVEIIIGTIVHDVCQAEYPLPPVRTERGELVDGVRISRNGAVLFQGGYDSQSEYGWYGPDGSWNPTAFFRGRAVIDGDYWRGYETDAGTVWYFARGPELTARGSWGGWALMSLAALLVMLLVRFSLELFLWQQSWYVQDPEPTEFYFLTEKIGWGLWVLILLYGYVLALKL